MASKEVGVIDAMDIDTPKEKEKEKEKENVIVPGADVVPMAGLSKKFEVARDKVAKDKFDVDAWQVMLSEVERKSVVVARPVYEQFLKVFPTSARHWRMYIEHEQGSGNTEAVDQLFKRCLKSTPNIDLWRKYVKYVVDTTGKMPGPNAHATVLAAFDLAANTVGYDINAQPLWQEYIQFVQGQVTDGDAKAENIKLDTLRKIYQRSVILPIHNLESLWRDYTIYETNRSKALANAMLNELAPRYMEARAACRERKNHLEGIQRTSLAVLATSSKKEIAQVLLWKRLIDFEKRNVLGVDPAVLRERVLFTFNQALLVLYRFPEIWYDLACFEMVAGGVDPALSVYDRASNACDHSLLLRFAHADLLESLSKLDAAKTLYEELLRTKPAPLVYIAYLKFARRAFGIDAARRVFFQARKSLHANADVYIAAAETEFSLNKDTTSALKIFELGLAKFNTDVQFMLSYVDFLVHLNDDANVRAVFEQMLVTLSVDDAVEVWSRYLRFERLHGSLSALIALEERYTRFVSGPAPSVVEEIKTNRGGVPMEGPQAPPSIMVLVQRQRYRDLWPCSLADLHTFVGAVNTEDLAKTRRHQKAEERKRQAHSLPLAQRKNPLRDLFDRPDVSGLMPFKMETFLGVELNLPLALSNFINDLPKGPWEGHVIDAEIVKQIILTAPLKAPEFNDDDRRGVKRKAEGDVDDVLGEAPKHDVFRSRQSVKLAKVTEGDKSLGE